jgi:hypothetical protein
MEQAYLWQAGLTPNANNPVREGFSVRLLPNDRGKLIAIVTALRWLSSDGATLRHTVLNGAADPATGGGRSRLQRCLASIIHQGE